MFKTVRIRFGQFTFVFFCKNQEAIEFFKFHFNEDISNSLPDVSIIVTILPTAETPNPGTRYTYSVDKEEFNFGPNLIRGSWDEKGKTCHLLISKSILKTEEIWLLNRLLCRIFYTLFMKRKSEDKKAFIVHSSGILRSGKGYVFFGPSGSGKSTIAHFSTKFEVLHDDMNIVVINDNKTFVEGIPFNPKQLELTNRNGSISMIFSLHKNDEVKIEKGTREEFAKIVLSEIVLPLPLLSEDRKHAFQYLLTCVKKLGEIVPYYRLYFKRDESFWHLIEEMEDIHGRHQEMLYQSN